MYRQQESMIGNSAALAFALERVSQVAAINRPIIIYGERGTGKELIAERLHYLSPRWDAPFLKVNCAALSDQLLESELFGHESGAFTGATSTRAGRFERADGGTLFLDEVATMSTGLQEKLLRLVEYGEYERLGGQATLTVDVRIVAATHADLKEMARQNNFREDLLDRLSFDVIHVPALSQRKEDIDELAQHFAVQMCGELGWELFPGFTPKALERLRAHPWPGNVRELKNVVERSVYRWDDPKSAVNNVILDAFKSPFTEALPNSPADTGPSPAPQESSKANFTEQVESLEKHLLQKSLMINANNQKRTAQDLGLSYDQLRGMIRKYNLSTRTRRS
ncbi:MAG: psp operon transcriptional activator [Halioglobus sp.]|jgi:psp operon transcriptional activator